MRIYCCNKDHQKEKYIMIQNNTGNLKKFIFNEDINLVPQFI